MKTLFVLFGLAFFCCARTAIAVEELTFAAAPRGSKNEETTLYEPIVNYLSKAASVKIRFVYSDNWLSYQKAVRDDSYDFYFSGPHFTSFLVTYNSHQILARLVESFTFVVAVRADETRFKKVTDLVARQNCLHPEPNLGTLLFKNEFSNPSRQPITVLISGWNEAYGGMIGGKCVAAVMPITNFEKFNKDGKAKILHTFRSVPNQAITASTRVPDRVIQKLRAALLTEEGCQQSCKPLLDKYASKRFVATEEKDYFGLSDFLKEDFLLGKVIADRSRSRPSSR